MGLLEIFIITVVAFIFISPQDYRVILEKLGGIISSIKKLYNKVDEEIDIFSSGDLNKKD